MRPVSRTALALLCLVAGAPLFADDADVPKIAGWLEGTFTSPRGDVPGSLGPLRVIATLVPKSRIGFGAPVLYVETAAASTPDRPYKQQFLRVEDAGPSRVVLKVFEPKDRISVSGKWREPADLALFGERDVVERKACHVTLTRGEAGYVGATTGTGCLSALGRARYVTQRMVVAVDRLEIASVGFDATATKVWGGDTLVFRRDPDAAPRPTPEAASARPAAVTQAPRAVPATTTPVAVPTPPQPGAVELLVRVAGVQKRLALSDLNRLPSVERKDGSASYRGASLRDVLRAAGVDTSDARRAALASTVVLAFGADDETAVLAAEEMFGERAPIVATESAGRALTPADGPLRLVVPGSPARSIRKLLLLDVRELSGATPLSR